jgi:hypothetical protein
MYLWLTARLARGSIFKLVSVSCLISALCYLSSSNKLTLAGWHVKSNQLARHSRSSTSAIFHWQKQAIWLIPELRVGRIDRKSLDVMLPLLWIQGGEELCLFLHSVCHTGQLKDQQTHGESLCFNHIDFSSTILMFTALDIFWAFNKHYRNSLIHFLCSLNKLWNLWPQFNSCWNVVLTILMSEHIIPKNATFAWELFWADGN